MSTSASVPIVIDDAPPPLEPMHIVVEEVESKVAPQALAAVNSLNKNNKRPARDPIDNARKKRNFMIITDPGSRGERIRCIACKFICTPLVFTNCIHVYCRPCFDALSEKKCVTCSTTLAEREISGLEKDVLETVIGECEEKHQVPLLDWEKHVCDKLCSNTGCNQRTMDQNEHDNTCAFVKLNCTFTSRYLCPWNGFRKDLQTHLSNCIVQKFEKEAPLLQQAIAQAQEKQAKTAKALEEAHKAVTEAKKAVEDANTAVITAQVALNMRKQEFYVKNCMDAKYKPFRFVHFQKLEQHALVSWVQLKENIVEFRLRNWQGIPIEGDWKADITDDRFAKSIARDSLYDEHKDMEVRLYWCYNVKVNDALDANYRKTNETSATADSHKKRAARNNEVAVAFMYRTPSLKLFR